jgi:hypothetical protein
MAEVMFRKGEYLESAVLPSKLGRFFQFGASDD